MIAAIVVLDRYNSETFIGDARVIDSDSLRVEGQEIRLFGIDAPEFNQTCKLSGRQNSYNCGRKSASRLKSLVTNADIRCEGSERDKYERFLAICWVGDVEINRIMVSDGWALAFGAYYSEEVAAQESRLGLWQGEFHSPSEWRQNARNAHDRGIISSIVEKFF